MAIYQSKDAWMATPEYQQLRRACFREQGTRCLDCGERVPLELHHLSYQFGPYPLVADGIICWGLETLADVVGLCRECHLQRHVDCTGEFWADPDEREAYWFTFHEGLERD